MNDNSQSHTHPAPQDKQALDELRRLASAMGVDIPQEIGLDQALKNLQARAGLTDDGDLLAKVCGVLLAAGGRDE